MSLNGISIKVEPEDVNDQEDSMSDELNISLENRLTQMGLSKILIDELVSVAVRVNYGQVSDDNI